MGAICPAERRVRDKCFERENIADADPPPPQLLRLPTAAVVPTASVAFAAARVLDARRRAGRQTPLTTTAYSKPPKSRDS